MRSRSQIRIVAASTVPRYTKSRLSYRVATARCWRRRSKAGGRAAAAPAAPEPAADLVGWLGDGGLDPSFPQVAADRPGRVRLVREDLAGPGPRPSPAPPRDPQAVHQGDERQRVVPLPGA